MKFTILLIAALIMTGCASNSPTTTLDAKNKQILSTEPSIDITVAAQSLSAWPFPKHMLTYTIVDKKLPTEDLMPNIAQWKTLTNERLIRTLNDLGLTYVPEGKARLTVSYGLNPPSDTADAADEMFNDIGLTTGSSSRGTAANIEISIKDTRTQYPIWTGAVSGQVDKPIKTEQTRHRVVNSLLDSLLDRLPQATE